MRKETANKNISSFLFFLSLICGSMLVIIASVFVKPVYIPSSSMEPTIQSKSFVLCERRAYNDIEPARQDIIVFWSDEEGKYLCKRIIGLPGDSVHITNGSVYINGSVLNEPYLTGKTDGEMEITVPDGMYFVLGDNRSHSYDSRYWKNPFIAKDSIYGKVVKE